MKQIEGELRSFVVTWNDHHGHSGFGKRRDGRNQLLQLFLGNVVLVEKVAAVNEQVGFDGQSMFQDFQEVFKHGLRPSLATCVVRRSSPDDLEAEMRIGGVNEFQKKPRLTFDGSTRSLRPPALSLRALRVHSGRCIALDCRACAP